MQYRRLKNMKRVVAAIVSAALIITAQPQTATTTLAAQVSDNENILDEAALSEVTENLETETLKSENLKTETSRAKSSNAGDLKAETSNVESSEAGNSKTVTSNVENAEDSNTKTSNAESSEAGDSKTENTKTETSNAESSEAEDSKTENTKTETSNAENSEAEDSKTETSNAESSEALNTESSEAENSETLNTESSETEDSKTETSNTENPDVEDSKTETSNTENPDVEDSKTETSNTENPDVENSETETSSTNTSETETPETETSETNESKTEEESEGDSTSTEDVETETAGTEEITDLETAEGETTENEATEGETTEEETTESETTEEETSVPIPEVDASVHIFKAKKALSLFRVVAPRAYASAQDPVEITTNEYRIENRDQFFGFLTGKMDYDGCTVTLACNIDMKSEEAAFGGRFAGTFDGNGYSIQNLKVEQGLFPVIQSGATVKNLHISNASMTGKRSAGVIAGRNDGTIIKCVVTGNLEASNDMDFTAGIVGTNEGNVENCVFAGRITAAAGTVDAEKDIAGIVGRNNGVVQSCYAVGSINTKAAVVAGIAGTNTSRESESIKNCANYMSIEGAYTIAGIVGINEGDVVGCTNYGTIRQKNNAQEVGEAGGIAAQNKLGTISDCYNYANVSGEDKNIGGIAATTSGVITKCGNNGSVTGLANVGGIVGLYNGNREYSISECFNQGNINGNGRTIKAVGIGGILGSTGEGYKVPIDNCYNTGNIRATKATQYLGGIAGVIYKGTILNCYNAGNVTGDDGSYAAMLVGFLGKEEDTSYANCLYVGNERTIAFFREEGGVSDVEMAKTTSDLKSQDILAILGGSFSSDSGGYINEGYPILNGQAEPSYRYPVVYELNGGYAGNTYFELINQDSTANKPEDPTKNYAEFQGWCSDTGLNVSYDFSTQIKTPVILYAKWKNDIIVEDMELLQDNIEMIIGEEYAIKVRFTPEKAKNAEMVWDSDDSSVVTVDDKGNIKAQAAGKATIKGTLKDNSLAKVLKLSVVVTNKDSIIHIRKADDGVEVDKLKIAVKESVTLEAVMKGISENAKVQWDPTNNEYIKLVPKIDGWGNPKATIEGIKPTPSGGAVEVNFSVVDGEKISVKSISVTVLPLATGVKVKLGDEDVTDKTVIYDLVTKKFIAVGTKKLNKAVEELSAVISPSDASQKVTWSSNNSSVVKFEDKESGVVTGNISGTAEVTAMTKDGSNKAGKTTIRTKRIVQSFVLEPKEVDKNMPVVLDSQGRVLLTSGCSVRLVPKFTPTDVTDEGLKWEMNPKNCLEIDAEKKIITAKDVKSETKVTLTATSLDGGGASYEMEFVIIPKVEAIEIYDTRDMKRPVNGKTIGVNPETDGKTFTLRVKNKPDYASQIVLWKSANTSVAAVTDHEDGSCTVTVNGYGKTDIIATAADGSGVTASVTVNVSSLVSSIVITGSNKVAIGGKIKLKAEVFPKSAANQAVVWETNMTSRASVNKTTGEVTGIEKGLVVIKATAADGGGATETFAIMVTEPVKTFDLMIPDGNTDLEDDVIVTDKVVGIDLDAGMETYTLAARILPEEASQAVSWKSSNEKIATVDEKGIITAKSLGKAVITATTTDGTQKTATTTVNVATLVRSISISGSHYVSAGQSIQLHAEVKDKDAANKSVNWKSSDKNAIIVDDSGLVTAVSRTGEAMAKITAEAADGSGKYAEHIIYVMGKSDKIAITEFDGRFVESSKKSELNIQDIKNRSRRVSFIAELSGGSNDQGAYHKEVEWITSNKSVAEVYSVQNNYNDSEAQIQIKKEGTVTITARTTDGSNREDSYTLNIIDTDPDVVIKGPKQVANGKKIQLSTEGSVAVTWSSLDPSLATVNANGKVTAKKNVSGTATITATSTKGTQKTDVYYVEVSPAVSSVDILVDGVSVKNTKVGMDLIKGYTMDEGKTWNSNLTLYASVADTCDNRVTWKSSKTAVATVDENGNVEIKKNGTAVITATATDGSGKKAKVTLVIAKQITKIEPEDGIQDIYVGYKKSVQLKLAYKPLAATTKKVTWESADKSLVSVNKNGKVTVKKPFGSGDYDTSSDNNVIITARAADGGKAFCEFRIHFVAPATKVQVVERMDNVDKEYVSIVGIDIDTNDAKTTLKANLTSTNSYAYQYGVSQKVTWKTSNASIAEVTPNLDGSCTITGLKTGKVTITATAADGSKKSGKVTVYVGKLIKSIETTKDIQEFKDAEGREVITLYAKSIKNKKTLQLSDKLIVNPITATNKKLTYKSSNSKLVSVNSSGKLTAKKRGAEDVIITITTNDGSGVKKEIVVRVLQ